MTDKERFINLLEKMETEKVGVAVTVNENEVQAISRTRYVTGKFQFDEEGNYQKFIATDTYKESPQYKTRIKLEKERNLREKD